MEAKHTPGPLFARVKHFGVQGCGTPYVSAGDSARALCFMNLSGAYGGCAGFDQAMSDARMFAAAPKMLAVLKRVAAASLRPGSDLDKAIREAIAEAEKVE